MITRRQFASGLAAAGTTSLLGAPLRAAEPPPETTRLRFIVIPDSICFAPQYVAEELLRAEGFTDVQYVKAGRELPMLLGGNREFARKHPVAVKRALRAILKANAICVAEPDRVARGLVDKGYAKQYEYAKEAIREIPYGRWREYDVVDTVRFYALRLHEAGFIKDTPQRILAEGVDLRFFDQLKRELKG
ncbi:MAG: hypothetical protein ACREJV_01740 [Candidatus Rokuibacteriota bacterium]